jgi:hypothetical protein
MKSPTRAARDVSAAGETVEGSARIFVSFDTLNDAELYERLLDESRQPGSGFSIVDCSVRPTTATTPSERSRRRISEADQVIVICGAHTEDSVPVSAELGIAREEGTPYFLLWGRREMMCTKPIGARRDEGMYSWTRQILREQIDYTVRKARSDAAAESLRTAPRKTGSSA